MSSDGHVVGVVGRVVVAVETVEGNLVQSVGNVDGLADVEGLRVATPLLCVEVGVVATYAEVVARPCRLVAVVAAEVRVEQQEGCVHRFVLCSLCQTGNRLFLCSDDPEGVLAVGSKVLAQHGGLTVPAKVVLSVGDGVAIDGNSLFIVAVTDDASCGDGQVHG